MQTLTAVPACGQRAFFLPVTHQRPNGYIDGSPNHQLSDLSEERHMLGIVLVVVLVLLLIGAIPSWPHSRSWGYGPSGGLGLILVILVVLLLMGRI